MYEQHFKGAFGLNYRRSIFPLAVLLGGLALLLVLKCSMFFCVDQEFDGSKLSTITLLVKKVGS